MQIGQERSETVMKSSTPPAELLANCSCAMLAGRQRIAETCTFDGGQGCPDKLEMMEDRVSDYPLIEIANHGSSVLWRLLPISLETVAD